MLTKSHVGRVLAVCSLSCFFVGNLQPSVAAKAGLASVPAVGLGIAALATYAQLQKAKKAAGRGVSPRVVQLQKRLKGLLIAAPASFALTLGALLVHGKMRGKRYATYDEALTYALCASGYGANYVDGLKKVLLEYPGIAHNSQLMRGILWDVIDVGHRADCIELLKQYGADVSKPLESESRLAAPPVTPLEFVVIESGYLARGYDNREGHRRLLRALHSGGDGVVDDYTDVLGKIIKRESSNLLDYIRHLNVLVSLGGKLTSEQWEIAAQRVAQRRDEWLASNPGGGRHIEEFERLKAEAERSAGHRASP